MGFVRFCKAMAIRHKPGLSLQTQLVLAAVFPAVYIDQ